MSRNLQVINEIFAYPDPGENPGWGSDASDWAEAVTNALADIINANDISITTFTVADNISIFTNVTGFVFDNAAVRSFVSDYNVVRSDGVSTSVESGFIYGIYTGTDWSINQQQLGDAGMTFQITSGGQIQYKSSSIGGIYSGTMKFKARTILAA